MTPKLPDRRKTLVILPEMQKKIVRRSMVMPATALIVLGSAVTWHCIQILGEAAAHDVDLPGLRLLLPSILGFVLAMGGLMFRQALHFSNKLGGPAYRIGKHLQEVRTSENGLPGQLKLREGDYLEELRDEVNLLVDWMRDSGHYEADAATTEEADHDEAEAVVVPAGLASDD